MLYLERHARGGMGKRSLPVPWATGNSWLPKAPSLSTSYVGHGGPTLPAAYWGPHATAAAATYSSAGLRFTPVTRTPSGIVDTVNTPACMYFSSLRACFCSFSPISSVAFPIN